MWRSCGEWPGHRRFIEKVAMCLFLRAIVGFLRSAPFLSERKYFGAMECCGPRNPFALQFAFLNRYRWWQSNFARRRESRLAGIFVGEISAGPSAGVG